jgi:curli biogenesis system outer membrane secretion channel CsgG
MKNAFRFAAAALIPAVIWMASCAVQSAIKVDVQKPAAIHLPGVHKLAIADFQGSGSSGGQISSLVQSRLLQGGHFEIVERDRLARILDEQKLGMAGVVNESTAKQVGQLLGVDALIFGEVSRYEVEKDEIGAEKVQKKEGTGKYETVMEKNVFTGKKHKVRREIMRTVWVDQQYRIRRGSVAVNFRVVDVETGKLLAAHTDSKSYTGDKVVDGGSGTLKPEGEILNELSESVARDFAELIAPHSVSERRVLESGSGKNQEGRKYALAGLWPEAASAWEEAMKAAPGDPSAIYNLGIAREVQGDLDEAEGLFKKAAALKSKKLYIDAISRIRQERKEKARLDEQMKDR